MAGAWLEIFKTGTHTSGNGVTKTYTAADLEHIVKTYNEQKEHEAPLVIGHPKTDSPAYGWAKELKIAGEKILAYVDQVADDIVNAVNSGSYRKLSIAIYPNGLLRHIGLLGAMPPAVKGLAPVQFSEEMEFDEYVWATDEYRVPTIARVLSNVRDFFIEKFGLESTNKMIDKADIEYLQTPVPSVRIAVNPPSQGKFLDKPDGAITNNYGENFTQEEDEMKLEEIKDEVMKALDNKLVAHGKEFNDKLDEKIATVMTAIGALTTQFSESRKTDVEAEQQRIFVAETASFSEFCEELIAKGQMLRGEKESVESEFTDLLKAEQSMTFAEGEKRMTVRMRERYAARPVLIKPSTGQFADGKRAQKTDISKVPDAFSEVADKVDAASVEIDAEIRAYAEKNKCSYEDAAERYSKGN